MLLMDQYNTPALVARIVNYGEADRICALITRDHGKISVLARGARRSRKRFGGALSLFVIGDAAIKARTRGDLSLLEHFDSLEDLALAISGDVIKVAHGSYLLELAREMWPEDQPEQGAFELLCAALRALAGHQPSPPLLRAFELQFLAAMGLTPCLDRCVACGEKPDDDGPTLFNLHRGGILCNRCDPHGWPLSPKARCYLLNQGRIPMEEAAAATPEVQTAREARDLMLDVVRHHLGKDLKSLEFIMKLRG